MSDKILQNQEIQGKRLGEISKKKHEDLVFALSEYLKALKQPASIADISRATGYSKPGIKRNLEESIKLSGCKFEVLYFGNAKVLNKVS